LGFLNGGKKREERALPLHNKKGEETFGEGNHGFESPKTGRGGKGVLAPSESLLRIEGRGRCYKSLQIGGNRRNVDAYPATERREKGKEHRMGSARAKMDFTGNGKGRRPNTSSPRRKKKEGKDDGASLCPLS